MAKSQDFNNLTINSTEGDSVVPFRIRHTIELSFEEIKDIFNDEKFTQDDVDEFIKWADDKATHDHHGEFEYTFALMPTDTLYLKRLGVPEKLIPVFEFAIKLAEPYQKERKAVLEFRLTFSKEDVGSLV